MARVPQRRFGRPDDLDGPLLLLVSEAGAYMTGAVIAVDGGHLVSLAVKPTSRRKAEIQRHHPRDGRRADGVSPSTVNHRITANRLLPPPPPASGCAH